MTAPADAARAFDSISFDPNALREKYRVERDRRLRPEGNDQYQEVKDGFAHFADDPYIEPGFTRAPLADEVDAVVVGGGFGGLLCAARLREAGLERVRIVEKGGDFGGTWYWNRYPGAQCDIESYIYLPLLEETGYMPVEKYTRANEILEHSRRIGRRFDLYKDALFQTEITSMRWEEDAGRWIVKTNRDDTVRARFVVLASGPLHRLKLPGIPGVQTFKGHAFHTSRWDYAYTGGDPNGDLTGLSDKRVGIIGTGATAVQCIPHLGASAKHLYVFQRTPSSIDVRGNRPTDPAWVESLTPGWQQRRMDNFNILLAGGQQDEDLVGDGWTEIFRNIIFGEGARKFASLGRDLTPEQLVELADFEKMDQIRARVDAIVNDKATAEALKPYYRQFCKRPCFHDEYLDTFNRDNVTLVDTKGAGVERITEHGVVANGVEYPLDCLIYATGFEVGTSYTRRQGFELYGRGGRTLSDHWANGTRTLHGFHASGFPNCFIVSVVQSGLSPNFPHMLAEQARHVAYIVKHCTDKQVRVIEVSPEAEAEWVRTHLQVAIMRRRFLEECTPGYYNNEGKPGERSEQDGWFGAGPVFFIKILQDWRAEGNLNGLVQSDK
jgi:cyclohexanone monooxygenase